MYLYIVISTCILRREKKTTYLWGSRRVCVTSPCPYSFLIPTVTLVVLQLVADIVVVVVVVAVQASGQLMAS